jgi:hypothetical protein
MRIRAVLVELAVSAIMHQGLTLGKPEWLWDKTKRRR